MLTAVLCGTMAHVAAITEGEAASYAHFGACGRRPDRRHIMRRRIASEGCCRATAINFHDGETIRRW